MAGEPVSCLDCENQGTLRAFIEVREVTDGWVIGGFLVERAGAPVAIVTTPDDDPYEALCDMAWELSHNLIPKEAA